jgi:hypothetical protein
MIKSYVVTIDEIDEPIEAVETLQRKMKDIELKKNSLGIISVHPDAVASGVYKAVCDTVAFPIVGMTCAAQGSGSEVGMYMISIMILTSDEAEFSCGKTGDMTKTSDIKPLVKECYLDLKGRLQEQPKLALVYVPFLPAHFPGEYIEVLAALDPAVALFGSVASNAKNVNENHNEIMTLINGEASCSSAVFALVSGNFTPEFHISSFTENAIMSRDVGEVTKVERNKIIEIDNTNASEFFKKIGFIKEGYSTSELLTSTFILDYNKVSEKIGNEVISRAPFVIENDGIVCFGYIRVGASISIALSTPDGVIETAHEVIEKIKRARRNGASTALMYSCVGRRVGLLNQSQLELETIKEGMADEINYVVAYSYGEICPTAVKISKDGKPEKAFNHEHNQTLIACVF